MKKLVMFYRAAKDELDKVIFPTKEQIRAASISVFVVVTIVALFLLLVDAVLGGIMSSVL